MGLLEQILVLLAELDGLSQVRLLEGRDQCQCVLRLLEPLRHAPPHGRHRHPALGSPRCAFGRHHRRRDGGNCGGLGRCGRRSCRARHRLPVASGVRSGEAGTDAREATHIHSLGRRRHISGGRRGRDRRSSSNSSPGASLDLREQCAHLHAVVRLGQDLRQHAARLGQDLDRDLVRLDERQDFASVRRATEGGCRPPGRRRQAAHRGGGRPGRPRAPPREAIGSCPCCFVVARRSSRPGRSQSRRQVGVN
mmetsp:Transcript_167944/g.534119  ORF Transcript_167944/g.534119 Transcript_167944/m.534119 type:complete len:251 (-) Transcript_167944:784-1536(-)